MDRRYFVISLLAIGMNASAALAQTPSVSDQIVRQLRAQGYSQITVNRTLLGRTRFVAIGGDQRREIIINPRTGEILRDFWTTISDQIFDSSDQDQGASQGSGENEGSQAGSDDDDDDKSDDSYDDSYDDEPDEEDEPDEVDEPDEEDEPDEVDEPDEEDEPEEVGH